MTMPGPERRRVQQADFRWERVGAPLGGAVVALAASPDFARDGSFFAATLAGLYRSHDGGRSWRRVGAGFNGLSLTAVAVSPTFADDGVALVASLEEGVFRVSDGGATWRCGDFRGRPITIAALAVSPDFARDGIAFAASMADGVFRSPDRGATWEPCNFGLLDLDVLALAISAAFGQDETLFAATATGVFRSQNGGRAWREAGFPLQTAAVQCLAISPDFRRDGTLFAGTDSAGLFRSADRGATWQHVGSLLGAACINSIALSPGYGRDRTVLVVTDSAVSVSRDGGENWSQCVAAPGALCLALAPTFPEGGPVLVGLSREGVYRSTGSLANWQAASEGLTGRRLTGLALSPTVATDRRMAAFGAGEGMVRSEDGGATWTEADEGLPSLQVTDAAIGVTPDGGCRLYAALREGIWRCPWGGTAWERVSDLPVHRLRLSPARGADATAIVATVEGDMWASTDGLQTWQRVDVPWRRQEVLALEVSPAFERDRLVFVALRWRDGTRVEVWQGTLTGRWRPAVHYESAYRGAAIAVPSLVPWDGWWYAAIGEQVYGPLRAEARAAEGHPAGHAVSVERPAILALAALPGPQAVGVLAATTHGLYYLPARGQEWQPLDAGAAPRPIVAVVPSPDYARDGSIYALEVGGTLWRLRHAAQQPSQRGQGEAP